MIWSLPTGITEYVAFRLNFVRIRWQWMGFQPQRASDDGRIDTGLIPPRAFITAVMNFAVVAATERDGEFIADLAAKRATLRRSQMMGIGGTAAADNPQSPRPRIPLLRHRNHRR